jgi:Family of unknown function (DUF6335)
MEGKSMKATGSRRLEGASKMARIDLQSWEELAAEEMAAFDWVEEPFVDDLGISYEAWEELAFGDGKEAERDRHRWELDPASAEDYSERHRFRAAGPAMRWRHFGH